MAEKSDLNALSGRFRGFYPVVIDVETAGFNANTDALLEIAAVTLKMDEDGWLQRDETLHFHVEPFEGANLQPEALAFNGIDPHNRCAARSANMTRCTPFSKRCAKGSRIAVATGPLSWRTTPTSISFLMAAAERAGLKRNPFHPFATFDTAALSGLVLGQTVLAKACIAGMPFDSSQAHSALYDTEQTALLFCELVNRWKRLGGWPLPAGDLAE
ncbi:ribonuclease T [Serratia marcescens]|nr:ribonuclease T [Serratia marcescens]